MGQRVAVVGVGQTHHSRRRTDVSQAGLVREAVDRALSDAKLTIEDIDSVVVASGPVLFAAVNQPEKWVVDAIGASQKPLVRITSGGGACVIVKGFGGSAWNALPWIATNGAPALTLLGLSAARYRPAWVTNFVFR